MLRLHRLENSKPENWDISSLVSFNGALVPAICVTELWSVIGWSVIAKQPGENRPRFPLAIAPNSIACTAVDTGVKNL